MAFEQDSFQRSICKVECLDHKHVRKEFEREHEDFKIHVPERLDHKSDRIQFERG